MRVKLSESWELSTAHAAASTKYAVLGDTVGKVEKETMKCGVVYEAKVKGPDGACGEIKVAEDGKLLKYKAGKAEKLHDKDSAQAK